MNTRRLFACVLCALMPSQVPAADEAPVQAVDQGLTLAVPFAPPTPLPAAARRQHKATLA